MSGCIADALALDSQQKNTRKPMTMKRKQSYPSKQKKQLQKELLRVQRQEQALRQKALRAKPPAWKEALEQRVPQKIRTSFESGFRKGFTIVFASGRPIIEKSYRKEELKASHAVHDYAMQIKGGRKEWRQLRREAKQADWLNLAATTAEGVGLGALGIGLPDIVLFLGMVLRGIYETALHYGFDYEERWEQLLILKMMAAALSTGEDWERRHSELDALLKVQAQEVSGQTFADQLDQTASVFAVELLTLKFVQGLPVVGVLGGAANPLYYARVMKYVRCQYEKRYLQKQLNRITVTGENAASHPFGRLFHPQPDDSAGQIAQKKAAGTCEEE